MKIKEIKFTNHPVFNNHIVTFGTTNIPSISFLVGNNGSGKTKLLEAIYYAMTGPFAPVNRETNYGMSVLIHFSDKEKTEFALPTKEIEYSFFKNQGHQNVENFIDANTGDPVRFLVQDKAKVVFSTIEVNFSEQNISSVTSQNIDNHPIPKGRSANLSTEIPQLLVDIKALDDADIAKWYAANKTSGHSSPFPELGLRLNRFTTAFHKIYDGEKIFHDIEVGDGGIKIIFTDKAGNKLGLNDLSTGEKQIIYRVGYILRQLGNIDEGIILIDEPEISLHPTWQIKLKDFLLELFKNHDVQLIIATHSPFIFKNLDETNEECIKLDRSQPSSQKISMTFPGIPYNPSVQLINYLAYDIFSELLHIELYTLLQIREHRDKINNSWNRHTNTVNQDGIENWLRDSTGGNIPVHKTFTRTGKTAPTMETIMTWIRNKIHHSDESARPAFTDADLKTSIDLMINLLK